MKIFAICIVRDEVDVLEKTIISALKWADKVIIADHNSCDGTWELIDEELRHFEGVEVYGKIYEKFNDGLRSKIYNKYRHLAELGDWWCRLDSDEFYIDNPKEFLSKVGEKYNVIRGAKFQYYFTEKDFENYTKYPKNYLNGNSVDNLKYYVCNESETRFVRHLNQDWKEGNLWPNSVWPHLIYPEHIRLKHFQYRYPEQIQHRIDLRTAIRKESDLFNHEVRGDWNKRISNSGKIDQSSNVIQFEQTWKERIIESKNLSFDDGREYIIRHDLLISKIKPILFQIIRNTIIVLCGRGKRIPTR
ncbi:glycosyltransferase family 2 protein [Pectobacterium aroidearum]|uniref:glycosyltransferase family 2 protein n=1 Tax=Pectobacterium aroidearum TaxID=1201031 RepID=UPI0015F4CF6C|nr:glycosyltransferase family 2 protein [Pectobacterium aroidearum]MBA5599881.1 glycosyltransferase family 2 protein [Pectobacterium aroidearum]